jgi:hypothetical protein
VEINRNQYFMIGIVILLIGLQIRWVESFVLNERASKFVAERLTPVVGEGDGGRSLIPTVGSSPRHTLHPPTWLGYALMSVGAVLILHSLAMKRPGG